MKKTTIILIDTEKSWMNTPNSPRQLGRAEQAFHTEASFCGGAAVVAMED